MVENEKSNVTPIELTSESPKDRIKELTDKLEQGIKDIFNSEKYKEYLNVMSKFHNYSPRNTLLILMQNPHATRVAGFNAWKENHNRTVKKGERGIKIIAPAPFTVKKETEKIDPKTNKPFKDKNGNPVMEETEITIPSYKVTTVFDLSQTEGEPLPTLANKLTADVENFKDFFKTLRKVSPVPIKFENIQSGANGYYHLEEKFIAIQKGMSEAQTLKTAIHEIAHAKLHALPEKGQEQETSKIDDRTREVQAESIAYTVCQHFGIDSSDYSFGYVAGWSSSKDTKELTASLDIINKTTAELINAIESKMPQRTVDKEQTEQAKENSKAQEQAKKVELSPEVKAEVDNAVKRALQTFIDVDITKYGSIQANTLEAVKVQGYTYENDTLIPQPTDKKMTMESVVDYIGKLADKIDKADITKTTGIATYNMTVKRLDRLYELVPPRQIKLRRMIENATQSTDLNVLKERMSEICDYTKTIEIEKSDPKQEKVQSQSKTPDKSDDRTTSNQSYARRDKTTDKTEQKPSIRGKIERNKAAAKAQPQTTRQTSKNLEVS